MINFFKKTSAWQKYKMSQKWKVQVCNSLCPPCRRSGPPVMYLNFKKPQKNKTNHFISIRCSYKDAIIGKQNIPHRDAHSTSELKRFLYFRISGASVSMTTGAGATFTFTRELRRTSVDTSDWLSSVWLVDRAAWLDEKPNMRKDRSEPRGCGGGGGVSILLTALQYCKNNI